MTLLFDFKLVELVKIVGEVKLPQLYKN